MREVEFFLDPFCPWAWNASRFVVEVAGPAELQVTWRFISLAVLNENSAGYPGLDLTRQLIRVPASAREHGGNDAVGDVYTALGNVLHVGGVSRKVWEGDKVDVREIAAEAVRDAGLPAHVAHAVEEPSYDELVRAETELALSRTGPDVGTPIITFDLARPEATSLFGPVIAKVPRGEAAVELWNALAVVADSGVSELKRSLRGDLRFD
ncbi:MAG: hypothetical protein ACOYOP_13300 [Microthrixaceae bacterium]